MSDEVVVRVRYWPALVVSGPVVGLSVAGWTDDEIETLRKALDEEVDAIEREIRSKAAQR